MSVIFPGLSYRQMYRKFEKVVLGLLVHLTPLIFFIRILRSEAWKFTVLRSWGFGGRGGDNFENVQNVMGAEVLRPMIRILFKSC